MKYPLKDLIMNKYFNSHSKEELEVFLLNKMKKRKINKSLNLLLLYLIVMMNRKETNQ